MCVNVCLRTFAWFLNVINFNQKTSCARPAPQNVCLLWYLLLTAYFTWGFCLWHIKMLPTEQSPHLRISEEASHQNLLSMNRNCWKQVLLSLPKKRVLAKPHSTVHNDCDRLVEIQIHKKICVLSAKFPKLDINRAFPIFFWQLPSPSNKNTFRHINLLTTCQLVSAQRYAALLDMSMKLSSLCTCSL